ncbi:MAG: NAD(P)H-dependent glycerol-3-phosphate dehydrogenase [Pseudomonadota bacterium]
MSKGDHLCVIGAGAWGTALAHVWCAAGNFETVTLLARTETQAEALQNKRENTCYLPGVALAPALHVTVDLEPIKRANHLAFVTPAQTFSALASQVEPFISANTTVVLCSKGIDAQTGKTIAETAATHIPRRTLAVLSGPSFAADVARGLPTAVTLATSGKGDDTTDIKEAVELATRFATPTFRIYGSNDVAGVEAGGALKNVMALAVGICRGLNLGASAEAALTTRGFAEMMRFAIAMGGRAETLTGLSGLGDLILTCSGPQSRNFAYGMALATNSITSDMPLAEGAKTATVALKKAQALGIDVPVITTVVHVLTKHITPRAAVDALMKRPLRAETST